MNKKVIQDNALEAVIYLKDGKRKYGMLMDTQPGDFYRFISNNDYDRFILNNNNNYIETVPAVLINTIDTYLK
jgi:hypothetical protein